MARPISKRLNRLWRALVLAVGTMRDTAAHLGVAPNTVYQYGTGMRMPSAEVGVKVRRLAKRLGVRAPKVTA